MTEAQIQKLNDRELLVRTYGKVERMLTRFKPYSIIKIMQTVKIDSGGRKRARKIMGRYLNRRLITDECVHHKNGMEDDNRLENLQIMSRREHARFHLKGKPRSEEVKKKISEAHIGKALTEEHCKAISEAHKGISLKKEHRRNISKSLKGIIRLPFSKKHKKKLSKATEKMWQDPDYREKNRGCRGYKWTIEQRENLSRIRRQNND